MYQKDHEDMIVGQIQGRGVTDPNVLAALRKVKRHLFVPEKIQHLSYKDGPLPIPSGQTISQPYIVAYMTEVLELKSTDRVLEIGTGSGYQAAILAELADHVYTIEIIKELAETADVRLKQLGYTNVSVRHSDGYKGWPDEAPFDAIILTAAPKEIPQALVDQLADGGRMVLPVGELFQELILLKKTDGNVTRTRLIGVRFVPMIHGE